MALTVPTSISAKEKVKGSFLKAKAAARIGGKRKANPMPLPASSDSSASEYELIPVEKGVHTSVAMSGTGGSRSTAHLPKWSQRLREANAGGYEYRVQKKQKKNPERLKEPMLSQFGRQYYAHEHDPAERERLDSAYSTVTKHVRSLFGKRRHGLRVTHPGGAEMAPGVSESMDFERFHALVDILQGVNGNRVDLHLTIADNSQDETGRIPAVPGTVTAAPDRTSQGPDRGRAHENGPAKGESSRSGAERGLREIASAASRGARMTASIQLNDTDVTRTPGMVINHLHPIPRAARGVPFTAPNDQQQTATAADEEDNLGEEIVERSSSTSPIAMPIQQHFIQRFQKHNEDGATNAKRKFPGIDKPNPRPRKTARRNTARGRTGNAQNSVRGNNVPGPTADTQTPVGERPTNVLIKEKGSTFMMLDVDQKPGGHDEMSEKLLQSIGPSQQDGKDGRYSVRQRLARNYNAEANGGTSSNRQPVPNGGTSLRHQPVANANRRTHQLRANTVYGQNARRRRAAREAEAYARRK